MMFPGNHCCVDCGREERGVLEYGSVGYGTLLCGVCAERHRMYTEEVRLETSVLNDDVRCCYFD